MKIQGKKFKLKTHRLKTVRPFVIRDLVLSDVNGLRPSDTDGINAYLTSMVEELLAQIPHDYPEAKLRPLLRLKVEYSGGFASFNAQRFGQQFVDRVANPRDILLFYRKRTGATRTRSESLQIPGAAAFPDQLDLVKMEDLVREYLSSQKLDVLPENELENAVHNFVEKDEKDAIKECVSTFSLF